jgi:hypothetical protein
MEIEQMGRMLSERFNIPPPPPTSFNITERPTENDLQELRKRILKK